MNVRTERRGLGRGWGELFQRTDLASQPPLRLTVTPSAAGTRSRRARPSPISRI